MPFKWVPNAAGTPADSHDRHFRFCPAMASVHRFVIKPAGANAVKPRPCARSSRQTKLLADERRTVNRHSIWRTQPISLRTPLALLVISLSGIAAVWWWLATPVTLARAPIDAHSKLECVSYAPFRA